MAHVASDHPSTPPFRLLGALDPEAFLETHWQKQPLLIRAAAPEFRSPVSADDLATWACDDSVESRLVFGRDSSFRLQQGPFDPEVLETLPSSDWTLLVQDVDKLDARVARLIDGASFLPLWRIDDVMVSAAAPGGGVGPHVDSYDVFLLQGSGRRRWKISSRFDPSEVVHPGGLKTVAPFEPEQAWDLEPGDVLYLPPGVAHHGVALDACLTFSVGLRAPSPQELLIGLADFALEHAPPGRYMDAGRAVAKHRGELDSADRARLRRIAREATALPDALLDRLLGRLLSEPKPHLLAEGGPDIAVASVLERLENGAGVRIRPACRALFIGKEPEVLLFVAGEEFTVRRPLAIRLSEGATLGFADLSPNRPEQDAAVLAELLRQGYAVLVEACIPGQVRSDG